MTSIDDIATMKNIERGDLIIVCADTDQEHRDARRLTKALIERFGVFVVIQPRNAGPIEKMRKDEFIKIARSLGIIPDEQAIRQQTIEETIGAVLA